MRPWESSVHSSYSGGKLSKIISWQQLSLFSLVHAYVFPHMYDVNYYVYYYSVTVSYPSGTSDGLFVKFENKHLLCVCSIVHTMLSFSLIV